MGADKAAFVVAYLCEDYWTQSISKPNTGTCAEVAAIATAGGALERRPGSHYHRDLAAAWP